mgnify:CR=1 FL=1
MQVVLNKIFDITTMLHNNEREYPWWTCLCWLCINFLSIDKAATPLRIFPSALLALPSISTPESSWKGWLRRSFLMFEMALATRTLCCRHTFSKNRSLIRTWLKSQIIDLSQLPTVPSTLHDKKEIISTECSIYNQWSHIVWKTA